MNTSDPKEKLPLWQCYKRVRAAKILAIETRTLLQLEGGIFWRVEVGYHEKHKPRPGGYYVLYEDGYESFSPAETFEAGYDRISLLESAEGHNPDRLSISTVGEGWRLLGEDEIVPKGSGPREARIIKEIQMWVENSWDAQGWSGNDLTCTFRTQLSREALDRIRFRKPRQ